MSEANKAGQMAYESTVDNINKGELENASKEVKKATPDLSVKEESQTPDSSQNVEPVLQSDVDASPLQENQSVSDTFDDFGIAPQSPVPYSEKMKMMRETGQLTVPEYMTISEDAKHSYNKIQASPELSETALSAVQVEREEETSPVLDIAYTTAVGYLADRMSEGDKAQLFYGNTLLASGVEAGREIAKEAYGKMRRNALKIPQGRPQDNETLTAAITGGALSAGELLLVGSLTGSVGAYGLMAKDVMESGAKSSVESYVSKTGDAELKNYDPNLVNVGIDALNAVGQVIIEKKLGLGKYIGGAKKTATEVAKSTVSSSILKESAKASAKHFSKEAVEGFLQEATQGELEQVASWVKGDQDFADVMANQISVLYQGLAGAFVQGTIGAGVGYHNQYKAISVFKKEYLKKAKKEGTEISEKDAEDMAINTVNAVQESGIRGLSQELIERNNLADDVGELRSHLVVELSKLAKSTGGLKQTADIDSDILSDSELAQAVEGIATIMSELSVVDAVERGVPVAEQFLSYSETDEQGRFWTSGRAMIERMMPNDSKVKELLLKFDAEVEQMRGNYGQAQVLKQQAQELRAKNKKFTKEENKAKRVLDLDAENRRRFSIQNATSESLRAALVKFGWSEKLVKGLKISALRKAVKDANIPVGDVELKSVLDTTTDLASSPPVKAKFASGVLHGKINFDFAVESGILQAWGYEKNQPAVNFVFSRKGGITDWKDIVELFQAKGLVSPEYTDTYEKTDALENEVRSLVLKDAVFNADEVLGIDKVEEERYRAESYLIEKGYEQEQLNEFTVDELFDLYQKELNKESEILENTENYVLEQQDSLDWDAIGDLDYQSAGDVLYNKDTININGEEKTVFNSNSERISDTEQGLRNFYEWFGDSKVVDEQGRPLVVYHGTDAIFDTFDKGKIGTRNDAGFFGSGFYFSPSSGTYYGKNVMATYLKIENMLDVSVFDSPSNSEWSQDKWTNFAKRFGIWKKDSSFNRFSIAAQIEGNNLSKKFSENVKKSGFDGITVYPNKTGGEYIVFEPNQIKSIDNTGAFSQESDNIYHQKKKGAYMAALRVIALGKDATVDTIAHELQHDWTYNNFKWYRSGQASDSFKYYWGKLEEYVGILPSQEVITSEQNESISRLFEAYLYDKAVPVWVLPYGVDLRDFMEDVYDELESIAIYAKAIPDSDKVQVKEGTYEIPKAVSDWFDRNILSKTIQMLPTEKITDSVVNAEAKKAMPNIIEKQNKEQEISNLVSAIPNIYDNIDSDFKSAQGGTTNSDIVSPIKRNIQSEDSTKQSMGKIGRAIGGAYTGSTNEAQAKLASDYIDKVGVEQAIDALEYNAYPNGMDANFIRMELISRLGDDERIYDLSADISDDLRTSAQTLQASRYFNDDVVSVLLDTFVSLRKKAYNRVFDNRYSKNEDAIMAKYSDLFLSAKSGEEQFVIVETMKKEFAKSLNVKYEMKTLDEDIDFQVANETKQERKSHRRYKKLNSIKAYRRHVKRELEKVAGVAPTRNQIKEIKSLSKDINLELKKYRIAVDNNDISALNPIGVYAAMNKMNKYLQSQGKKKYLGNFPAAANAFMMSNMLSNPATQITNIGGNTLQFIPYYIAKGLTYGSGSLSLKEKSSIIAGSVKTFFATGYNQFSIQNFFDPKEIVAEEYYTPSTIVGKVAMAPLTALGFSDSLFRGATFINTADSIATNMAKTELGKNAPKSKIKELARTYFFQAMNQDPKTQTIVGKSIRDTAVETAKEATFTQKSLTANWINSIRRTANLISTLGLSKQTGLGSFLVPFTTTIVNIVSDATINYTGATTLANIPKVVSHLYNKYSEKSPITEIKGTKLSKTEILKINEQLVKTIIGAIIIPLLVSLVSDFDDEDFVLPYDLQTDVDKYLKKNHNAPSYASVRLGGKWVALDVLGAAKYPLQLKMFLKRYNGGAKAYTDFVKSIMYDVPGADLVMPKQEQYFQQKNYSDTGIQEQLLDQITDLSARLVPYGGALSQAATISDPYKRANYERKGWDKVLDKIKSRLPGVRKDLPKRYDDKGNIIKETADWGNWFTGSKIKDAFDVDSGDKARIELIKTDNKLMFRNKNSSLSKLPDSLFKKADAETEKLFANRFNVMAKTPVFISMDDEQKKDAATRLHKNILSAVKIRYNLEPLPKITKRQSLETKQNNAQIISIYNQIKPTNHKPITKRI